MKYTKITNSAQQYSRENDVLVHIQRQHFRGCDNAHINRLIVSIPGHKSIVLHCTFNVNQNFNPTRHCVTLESHTYFSMCVAILWEASLDQNKTKMYKIYFTCNLFKSTHSLIYMVVSCDESSKSIQLFYILII